MSTENRPMHKDCVCPLKRAYLFLYNSTMCAGWATILYKVAEHLLNGGSSEAVYEKVSVPLVIFQTGALAEIVHAMIGLVRSPVGTTSLQLLSRLIVLYGAIQIGDGPARRSPFFVQMILAWAMSEIIRYSFYAFNILVPSAKILTWLRYSAFILLYPLGISGEVLCMYKALNLIKEKKPWTSEMPNRMNFTFSWYNGVRFILAIYPVGSYVMYSYMLSRRKKVLKKHEIELEPNLQ